MVMNRRSLLKGGAAATVFAPTLLRQAVAEGGPIVVGSMYDLSGGLEAYGKSMSDALKFAVDELNAAGGLLGRQIKVVSFDTQSNMQLYAQYAQEAALKSKVAVVHGGITSASREIIRPVLNRYKTLYFYSMPYEGGVCDRNVFVDGATPGHNTEVMVDYAVKTWGKKGYILAADYNYGQISSDWVKKYAKERGGGVIGTEFFPIDATNFSSTISKIQAAKPDWIMTVLVGGGPISFYRQFNAAGLSGKIPIMSTTFGGSNEQMVLTNEESNGIVVAYNYVEDIDTPANKDFLRRFRAKMGADYPPVTDLTMSSYLGVLQWAEGVKKAGTIDRDKVIEALESGLTIDGPSGKIMIDPQTHHSIFDVRLAKFKDKKTVILDTLPQRKPIDVAAVCDLKRNPRESKQYVITVK
ncbi:urea transport system substrate-binding protein [Bradyrhizobium sp. AZCC 2262]|uniref:urea ABC transporter substrate-binding protein n=1 Tax=Bradyrhizobium sp. AZCC 2262 TaxID=3117022 RepID=UPI002FF14380